ncbi:repressor operon pur transcription purine transcriptional purr regulation dna-binding glycosyltransferase [Lucifera butyrica]|uniref:Repressor operon pur transcription purine transcriptional purr regulation dna-binding glycosyltransferase n=1 Tax=Lucifera butyrica TaxID=1351585 RepID=A0A498RBP2_9FIRM|nr:pur operon repressor [Lucifera butyrica]VBB06558.1 repressor operon pur transcription purine transcriptional purr regulation dna-binding glycosyltransferase [Lucifera butyrica]
MEKVRRMERVVALTKLLVDNPCHLFSLTQFSDMFGTAKSTLSEDMVTIRDGLGRCGFGTLETVAGAAGGVRFLPYRSGDGTNRLLTELATKLATPDRMIPGGFLYMLDILFTSSLMVQVGEIFMTKFHRKSPDYIMTVETKGIPLAFMTARAFNLPLVMVRRDAKVTEGSTVSINYVTGSSKRIQTMSLPKRAIRPGSKVLIIDDFMKAGGTARGMIDLAGEVGADVVGTGVLVATAEPQKKLVEDYLALLILHDMEEHTKTIDIRPAFTD